ncbi:MaoC family dehydratase [Candidatus Woesearchaeota archaeon]|nr:MaoC family dehydratase [Candidatus Woesearchaeota archaeon]
MAGITPMHDEGAKSYSLSDLAVGMYAVDKREIDNDLISAIAHLSGDHNPIHWNETYARDTIFKEIIAHGLVSDFILSTMIGMELPGEGSIYRGKSVKFLHPVKPGDILESRIELVGINEEKRILDLEGASKNQSQRVVAEYTASVMLDPSQG